MMRTRLLEITENGAPSSHGRLIEALRKETGHSIRVLTAPGDNLRFNCVMYAFGIETDQEYVRLVRACPLRVHADTAFVQFLIEDRTIVEQVDPQDGLLAVYFDDNGVRHIGRLSSESRVVSKWGMGHLYEHSPLEVPQNYGNVVRSFSAVDRSTVLDRFVVFARVNGVPLRRHEG